MAETTLGPELGLLIEAAKEAAGHAYAPYSGFGVGAAVLGGSGVVHVGCNVESGAYPAGVCAERVAVGAAIAAGEQRLVAVAVAGRQEGLETLVPCGVCLQLLAEFGPGLTVVSKQRGRWVAQPVGALLPMAFSLPERP
jgi:cytidine deaminase